jgi:hypothetical protein
MYFDSLTLAGFATVAAVLAFMIWTRRATPSEQY